MKSPVRRFLTVATLLATGLAAGLVLSWHVDLGPARAERNVALAENHEGRSTNLSAPESPFVDVADRVFF